MKRKIAILFIAAFTSVFGVGACGGQGDVNEAEQDVKEAEQDVEEAKQEVKVKEAEQEEKEAELKVQEEKQEEKQEEHALLERLKNRSCLRRVGGDRRYDDDRLARLVESHRRPERYEPLLQLREAHASLVLAEIGQAERRFGELGHTVARASSSPTTL